VNKYNSIGNMVKYLGSLGRNSRSFEKELGYIKDQVGSIRVREKDPRTVEEAIAHYMDINSDLDRLARKLGMKDFGLGVEDPYKNENDTDDESSATLLSLDPDGQGNREDRPSGSERPPGASQRSQDDPEEEKHPEGETGKGTIDSGKMGDESPETVKVKAGLGIGNEKDEKSEEENIASSMKYTRFLSSIEGSPVTSKLSEVLPAYMLDRQVRTGAFASLFYGNDEKEENVAIKMPTTRKGKIWPPSALWEFLFDVDRWKTLEHENIVRMRETKLDPLPHIVMEKMEGGNLYVLMKKHRLSISEATFIMLKLLKGISFAHKRGEFHRDLKPTNILFCENGIPKITDWGWGKYLREAIWSTRKGQDEILGYCSPEQIDPGKFGDVDARTDIYQLGVIYYEMIAGINPFLGKGHAETLEQIKNKSVTPPSRLNDKVPPELEEIVLKAMEKRKEARWKGGEEMYSRLNEVNESSIEL